MNNSLITKIDLHRTAGVVSFLFLVSSVVVLLIASIKGDRSVYVYIYSLLNILNTIAYTYALYGLTLLDVPGGSNLTWWLKVFIILDITATTASSVMVFLVSESMVVLFSLVIWVVFSWIAYKLGKTIILSSEILGGQSAKIGKLICLTFLGGIPLYISTYHLVKFYSFKIAELKKSEE